MISVHEERRWPFTGALVDAGCGQVFNLPGPARPQRQRDGGDPRRADPATGRGVPAPTRVLQCGADAVEEDPLSRLALSNNAPTGPSSRPFARSARATSSSGGGGYKPLVWAVSGPGSGARFWVRRFTDP